MEEKILLEDLDNIIVSDNNENIEFNNEEKVVNESNLNFKNQVQQADNLEDNANLNNQVVVDELKENSAEKSLNENIVEQTKAVKKIEVSKNDLTKFENSESYRVHLENFDGPLDLLLYLIKDSKVEIQDVKLADITEQYLEYMQDLDRLDMEKAAEFIEIAATLLEIKSKSLIPVEREEVEVEEDPEQLLMMRLKEYKMIKEQSEKLKLLENVNRLYKAPDESCNDYRIVIKQMKLDNLINAFSKLLARVQTETINEEERTIERDRWTVEDKIFEVKTMLRDIDCLKFTEMVADDYTRGEIITLFSALLELLKRQIIEVEQEERFGEILITKGECYDG